MVGPNTRIILSKFVHNDYYGTGSAGKIQIRNTGENRNIKKKIRKTIIEMVKLYRKN